MEKQERDRIRGAGQNCERMHPEKRGRGGGWENRLKNRKREVKLTQKKGANLEAASQLSFGSNSQSLIKGTHRPGRHGGAVANTRASQ